MKSLFSFLAFGWLSAVLWLAPLGAADLRNPAFMKQVEVGFTHIYNLDYRDAQSTFEVLRNQYPDHPAPPLYIATAIWLRELFTRQELDLENFIAPSYFDRPTERRMPEAERQAFSQNIEESQRLANVILEKEPGNQDARYFLGSGLGVLASFSITIDRSRSAAFRYGKRAYKIHHGLVEENPEYYDAYMSVGIYEYIVGNLPWYIKWIAAIVGYRGSVERGFQYLNTAADRGQFVADDARVLQMVLYVREKRYQEALKNVLILEKHAPRSFILHLNKAQILEKLGRKEEAVQSYLSLIERAQRRLPNYHLLPLETMRYTVGRKLLELGKPETAFSLLEESRLHPETPTREKTLSTLLVAQILEKRGEKAEAELYYEEILEQPDFDGSHRQARRALSKLRVASDE